MIWVIGAKGMLGQEVRAQLSDYTLLLSDLDVDITNPDAMFSFVEGKSIDWIVNCSAYTAVDKAEDEPEKAFKINEEGVRNIGAIAQRLGAKVIHISTDYVFPGTENRALTEEDEVGPIGVYGKSKLAGELALKEVCSSHFILRTAWLYGRHGNNFVYTMLKLMNNRESLTVVDDQMGSPTWTSDLAKAIEEIVKRDSTQYGVYHFSGEGSCSWFEFAGEIYRLGKEFSLIEGDCDLQPCDSTEFPTKATRPAFSLMSKEKIKKAVNIEIRDWKESLLQFMKGLKTDA